MNAMRLRRALQLKQLLERVRVNELAEAEANLLAAERQVGASELEHERRIADLTEATVLSAVELAERARFVAHADQELHRERASRQAEFERRELSQAEAHLATRDVRTLERLYERDQLGTRLRHRRAEQQLLDEHGQRRRGDR